MAGGALCERKFAGSKIEKTRLIAELYRRESIAEVLHYSWFTAFLEAGKRLAGETAYESKALNGVRPPWQRATSAGITWPWLHSDDLFHGKNFDKTKCWIVIQKSV